ncbi:MAG: hypothetical protein IPH26_09975 [Sterolibacteriaceae bacterium]|uniref:Uncharacterized protein n=1 Tax=Candidatus Methylophosphatis roskildensis TaxID=2899263 RepID=A0A9D7E3U6_9PROT|nr:hypothetical protein [Candidatus Methylophosphatis roskildensis]MBK7238184.1 hypothetical protein [Sterolibacteriaceae bacterium]
MYGAIIDGRASACGLVRARQAADIAFLVKEAEILTGLPGRQFVVAGSDRLVYRVAVGVFFFEVTRLDEPFGTDVVRVEELGQHRIGVALHSGHLFTPVMN